MSEKLTTEHYQNKSPRLCPQCGLPLKGRYRCSGLCRQTAVEIETPIADDMLKRHGFKYRLGSVIKVLRR